MAMLWKQVKIYKWACGQVLNVDLNFVPYRYIIFLRYGYGPVIIWSYRPLWPLPQSS